MYLDFQSYILSHSHFIYVNIIIKATRLDDGTYKKKIEISFFNLKIITGNHAIGTVRKFPTLPLNSNGVWIDPAGGIWRQASDHGQSK